MRKYHYYIVSTNQNGKKTRWNLYVRANRMFSLKEILAKQHFVLAHIDELPFNHVNLKTASCRESFQIIEPVPSTVAFHVDDITLDKVKRKIIWSYDFVLEFVFQRKKHIEGFLEFLQKHWSGTWERE